jgi:hypothetical protein
VKVTQVYSSISSDRWTTDVKSYFEQELINQLKVACMGMPPGTKPTQKNAN